MSLLEVAAAMGANVVLVAAALSLLLTTIRADNQLAARDDRRLQLAPMLRQVRDDLRAAASARFEGETLVLPIAAGGEVRYSRQGEAWQRQIIAADAAEEVAGVYRLPEGASIAMTPVEASAGEVVRVAWSLPPEIELPNRPLPPAEEIVVAVGRDRRLLHP
jgi:type II secretory pathway component PulJ